MIYVKLIHKKLIKAFEYLVVDFGYRIIEKSYFGRTIYVKFCSNNSEVAVYVEGNYVGLSVMPLIEIPGIETERDKRFELYHILNVIHPNVNFKENEEQSLGKEIKRISYYFLKYCKEIIKGDFSIWPTLFKRWIMLV